MTKQAVGRHERPANRLNPSASLKQWRQRTHRGGCPRGTVWSTTVVAASLLAAPVVFAGVAPFTVAVLPDTQGYSFAAASGGLRLFEVQTSWLAAQRETLNLRFISHVGDIVDNGSSIPQWEAAAAAMDLLRGVVPHGVLPGNHDYASTGNKASGLANYTTYMGPSRFDAFRYDPSRPVSETNFFGGFMPDDFGGVSSSINIGNSYQLFTSGQGHTFLHLALEWQPDYSGIGGVLTDRKVLQWAQSVIDRFPGVPTIVTTHEDLRDADPNAGNGGPTFFGQHVFNNLVRRNDQVFMVLSGHNHYGPNGIVNGDGEWRRVDLNDAGNPVFRMMTTFQDWPNFGDGYLRLIHIDLDAPADNILVRTYSPYRDIELVDFIGPTASRFSYDLDIFAGRFPAIPEPSLAGAMLPMLALLKRRR
ncbi:MAG: metallophosphoesterase [Tepidisphaerales bacterium]